MPTSSSRSTFPSLISRTNSLLYYLVQHHREGQSCLESESVLDPYVSTEPSQTPPHFVSSCAPYYYCRGQPHGPDRSILGITLLDHGVLSISSSAVRLHSRGCLSRATLDGAVRRPIDFHNRDLFLFNTKTSFCMQFKILDFPVILHIDAPSKARVGSHVPALVGLVGGHTRGS